MSKRIPSCDTGVVVYLSNGDGSAVTYDVVGSAVGKRLMLTCEMPKVAK